jgi:hypothetical protein
MYANTFIEHYRTYFQNLTLDLNIIGDIHV